MQKLHSSFEHIFLGRIAQSVEQKTENLCVGGSIPPSATSIIKHLHLIYNKKIIFEHILTLDLSIYFKHTSIIKFGTECHANKGMVFLKNIISVTECLTLIHLTNTEISDTKKTAVNIYMTAISDFFP